MIDKTTAAKIIKPLCGLRGFRKDLETLPLLITIASGAQSTGHLEAAVQSWMYVPANQFPSPGEFRAAVNALAHIYQPEQHGCEICENSARDVSSLYLVTFIPNTYRQDPRQPAAVVQRNWRSEFDDTPETKVLRAKLGANQRLVSGARKCACGTNQHIRSGVQP